MGMLGMQLLLFSTAGIVGSPGTPEYQWRNLRSDKSRPYDRQGAARQPNQRMNDQQRVEAQKSPWDIWESHSELPGLPTAPANGPG